MILNVILCAVAFAASPQLVTVNDVFGPRAGGKAATPVGAPRIAAARTAPRTGSADVVIELDRDLHLASDITMNGVHAVETLRFTVPESWKLSADARLTLDITPSPALLLALSSLNVDVNGTGVAAVAYPAAGGGTVQLTVDIPRSVLRGYNTLTLTATQHYTTECEDPFHPSLWVRISNRSTIAFWRSVTPVVPSLDRYPYPLFDPRGYGPVELTLVVPESLTPELTEAIGRIAVAFGRFADYRGVRFQTPVARVEDARTAAVVVTRLDGSSILDASLASERLVEGGVVAVRANPANRSLPVLVLAGYSDASILQAALAASTTARLQALAGGVARVDRVAEGAPPPPAKQGEPPHRASYPLSAVGFADATVRGFYAVPISIPLALSGDAHAKPSGGSFEAVYAYPPGLDGRLSRMEVALDGVTLRSVRLEDAAGAERAVATIRIPGELVRPDSVLQVVFQLYPLDFNACERISDRPLWATLFADSTLELPLDHFAQLPALESLKHRFWPFNAETSDTPTEILLPANPTPTDLSAAAQLAALIGSRSRAASWPVTLVSGSTAPGPGASRVSLAPRGATHERVERLRASGLLQVDAPGSLTLRGDASALTELTIPDGAATLEAIIGSEGNDLVLQGASSMQVLELAWALSDPENVTPLAGNAALLSEDGTLRSFRTVEPTWVGEPPARTAGRHPGGAIAAAAIGVLFGSLGLRKWARARGGAVE